MTRFLRGGFWFIFLVLAGCADNAPAVLRDYYNVQNEIIDHMVYVCDEDTAKSYNELIDNRLKPREQLVSDRLEKLLKGQVSQTDKENFGRMILDIQTAHLKGEMEGIDGRYNKQVNRIRRIIVKMTEQKVEEMKAADKSFTAYARTLFPNLSDMKLPDKFEKNTIATAVPNVAPAGAQGGMPGGAMPGGGMPGGGMPGGAPGGAGGQLSFSIECERIIQANGTKDWKVTRRWKAGNTEVLKKEVNGIDLAPLFGD